MSKTRYKIRKAQLERVVESFVNESVAPEAKKDVQGYNDKENESLGMRTGKESTKKQSDKARREDSYGKWGKRGKYSSEAKKHKMSMGSEQSDDMGQGMKKAPQSSSSKMKYAPEAKKHVKKSMSESKRLNEVDPLTVGLGVTAIFAAAGGMAALDSYYDKLKKGSKPRFEKIMKHLRALGSATAGAKRGSTGGTTTKTTTNELKENRQMITEIADPITVVLGIAALISAAVGATAAEEYVDKMPKEVRKNSRIAKFVNHLRAAGKSTADAKRGNR